MKRLKFGILFAAIVLLSLGVKPLAAIAESSDSTGSSNAEVQFEEGSTVPEIVDPTDPDKPIDKEDPDNPTDKPTEEDGPLSLDYVSSVDFGKQSISGQKAVYESTSLKPFIQVTDARGTGNGWHVTAEASGFSTEEGTPSLRGATLAFNNGSVLSTSGNVSGTPKANTNIALATDGTPANVVTAGEDEGLGTWINRWFPTDSSDNETNDNVTLEIPAGSASKGAHSAEITWTLTSAPTEP